MKTTLSTRSGRSGMTYITVVVTMIVVGVMLAAYLKLISVQTNLAGRSQNWNRGIPVVEAGIEEAMAHLNKNGSPDSGGTVNVANLGGDGWSNDGSPTGPWHKQGYIGDDYYLVEIGSWNGSNTTFPTVLAAGYVRNNQAYALNYSSGPFLAAVNFPLGSEAGNYSRRMIQCGLTNNPTFTKALVAKHGIDLNGNNVFTDSYDSRNSSFSTGGRWDASKHRANGDVASNDTVTNSINVGNANIYGRISTGPSGTIAIGPQGKVGDLTWQANSANNGSIQPGFSTDDMNVEFPDVVMPTTAWGAMPAGGTVSGVTYAYIFNSSGDYQKPIGSGDISGKILINAPNVRIRVDTGWSFSGDDQLLINSNANVKIYLNCASADMEGKGVINSSGTPDQCYIFGTSLLRSLDVGGNGEITSVIYAPSADVTLHGGGSGDQDFSGSIMANSFRFVGHYSIHYDEALGRIGLWRGFTIISWNER